FGAVRYWFWSAAVYGACAPVAGWSFFRHLRSAPAFERTPKGADRAGVAPGRTALLAGLGGLALGLAWCWWSPFRPVLAAQGTAWVCFPAYRWLNEAALRGRVSRALVWLPGALLLAALYTIWSWADL